MAVATRWAGVAVPVLCTALALGTAACSSDGAGPRPTAAPSTARSSPTPSVSSAAGARNALTGLRCGHDARGRWSATGTLTNPTASPIDYAVSVFVVKAKTGTVVGQASRKWRVAPGRKKKVALRDVYGNAVTAGLSCVPNVTRGRT
jgi:hypothetical protein